MSAANADLLRQIQLIDLALGGIAHAMQDGCAVRADEIEIVRVLTAQVLSEAEAGCRNCTYKLPQPERNES